MKTPLIICKYDGCPNYKNPARPMKLTGEYFEAWAFVCPVCQNTRVVTKDKVGGTFGAGQRANGCRTVVGRGL